MTNGKTPAANSRTRLAILAVFAFNAVYFPEFFPPANNPNELSRIEAIVALVDHGTFAIDVPLKKYGDHEDKSVYGGHAYSNKAPGLVFAGIVVYGALRIFAPQPENPWAPLFVLTRLLTVSLVSLLALTRLTRRLAQEPFRDVGGVVILAVALGTPFLFYGRSFFSHAWTGSLLFLAWDAVVSAEERGKPAGLRMVWAGLLAGFAMISEYTVGLVVLLLGLRVLLGGRFPAAGRFCLGALPPLALLLVYNFVCFGSPWSLSSEHEAAPQYAEAARHGVFGIGPPSVRVMLGFLFNPSRGLVLFSPFWLWAVPGFVSWWRSGRERRDCVFAAIAVVSSVIVLSGYAQWEGGFCLGSRYLVPLTFFAALGIPFAFKSRPSRWLFAASVSFSVAQLFLLTSSWPYIAWNVVWPVANVAWWMIVHHWVAPNLGHYLGMPPVCSLVVPGLATAGALWLGVGSLFGTRSTVKTAVAVGTGILALVLLIAIAPPLPDGGQWRSWLIHFLEG
ncbi:MAG TPA: hypothetical protein VGQ75_00975 [Thermoanaerobaculia bacterium]|nr:hypothetical protein [Thermoanaerobaculia bacterium]